MIRNISGRSDAYLNIQGPAGSNYPSSVATPRLNWTSVATWDRVAFDAGYYGNLAGNWTFSLTAASPGAWGCNRPCGHMFIVVIEI